MAMTAETRQATRQHFHDNALACITAVESGAVVLPSHVTLADYSAWRRAEAEAWMRGDHDHSFTFLQYAEYLETGTCRALLP